MFTHAIRSLAALAAAASLGIMAYAGLFSSGSLTLAALGFAAWACAPYAIAWLAARSLQGDIIASSILALGLVIIAAPGLYAYIIVFIAASKPDAQAGLVFLVIPLYQLSAVLLTCALALLVKRLRRA